LNKLIQTEQLSNDNQALYLVFFFQNGKVWLYRAEDLKTAFSKNPSAKFHKSNIFCAIENINTSENNFSFFSLQSSKLNNKHD